ncbi:hypothetical protein FN846DRAFT_890936 [Sphaerosporella brunnea]|uniref:Uncharacterized protein n=1 Tax=Sphaerosporella brunnea TaxID=1250544 RepID=A0A5J5EUY3_9PEZI|nr:hypothetical protein FN846DRAFT_890936 [Sphaerosporella brunnea]
MLRTVQGRPPGHPPPDPGAPDPNVRAHGHTDPHPESRSLISPCSLFLIRVTLGGHPLYRDRAVGFEGSSLPVELLAFQAQKAPFSPSPPHYVPPLMRVPIYVTATIGAREAQQLVLNGDVAAASPEQIDSLSNRLGAMRSGPHMILFYYYVGLVTDPAYSLDVDAHAPKLQPFLVQDPHREGQQLAQGKRMLIKDPHGQQLVPGPVVAQDPHRQALQAGQGQADHADLG